MKIGFVGAGHIGTALAGHFARLDHDLVLSNSRGPETLAQLVEQLGPNATAGTTEEAIAFGEIVVVTIPLKAVRSLPAEAFAGKTVIDTCNYYPERDGQFPELDNGSTTESEVVAAHLEGADVVKAFNSIYFVHLAEQGKPSGDPERRAIPIASDSGAAKQLVAQLIDQIGFEPVDAGELSAGRKFENGAALYGAELTGPALAEALANA
ncbi:MAG: NADPH-dependent F420 reductase [Solirubrobacteraceae bacterium]|nr:NADPH-dependent F420 reductase [Patulibacter sp.]